MNNKNNNQVADIFNSNIIYYIDKLGNRNRATKIKHVKALGVPTVVIKTNDGRTKFINLNQIIKK